MHFMYVHQSQKQEFYLALSESSKYYHCRRSLLALFSGFSTIDYFTGKAAPQKRIEQNQILFDCRNKEKDFQNRGVGWGSKLISKMNRQKCITNNQQWIHVYFD